MSKTSDSEDDNSESADEMYLNKKLKYKVLDSNGKEKPRPYFKLNHHKSVPVIGQTADSKKLIFDILHSLNKMTELIDVSRYSTLLNFGMGLAAIDHTEMPSDESSLFVLFAAKDCAVRANHILRQVGTKPKKPDIKFRGDVIAAGMIEYWQKGEEC